MLQYFSCILFLLSLICKAEIPDQITGTNLLDLSTLKTNHSILSVPLTQENKITVVTFLSAKCPCSASHEVALAEIQKKFSNANFQFVGIHSNADEPVDMASEHFKNSVIRFPVLQDENNNLANLFGALKTPHVFVLNSKKEVLFKGGVDDSKVFANAKHHYLQDALSLIQNGEKPKIYEARTLGCVIKRQ